jgi:hypothetical protein
MSALSIQVPFPVFQDRDGQPLENGYVWIGVANLNPQTNPVVAYYDAALTIPAPQPLRTLNGYVSRAGSPAQVYVDGVSFSILVQDSKGSMVYNFPDGTGISPNAAGIVYDPAGTGAVATTAQTKLRESVSVKDFGAVGDGVTDDTAAINNCLAANSGNKIHIPSGTYNYTGGGVLLGGAILSGDGRSNTTIRVTTPTPSFLFNCSSSGSGITDLNFTAAITQTAGSWVLLSGIESFIDNFYMNWDFNGILMTGVAARIRHGRMQDGAIGAIRIRVEGGDTSQCIDDVLMGAQTPANIASAGIRVRNSSALMITNTSVIQQGVGLLIDPTSPSENVFSLYASKCFFDNGTFGIKVAPTGGAGVYRSRFTDVWASSSSSDGINLNSGTPNTISGLHFESCHCVLNAGAGFTTGSGCEDISIRGGLYCQNQFGMYLGSLLKFKITEATIGIGGGLSANSNTGILISAGSDQFVISGNIIVGNPTSIDDSSTGAFRHISNNVGYVTASSGTGIILSGTTSIVVNHGLSATPLVREITLVRGGGNAGSTDLFADSVTSTQFRINTAAAPSSNMPVNFTIRSKGA